MASARRQRTDPPSVALSQLGPLVRCGWTEPPTYLALWGLGPSGRWWALLGWIGYLHYDFREYTAVCSAWALAEDVQRVEGTDYSAVARVRLGPDPAEWPRPWLATDLHYPLLTREVRPEPPEGARWDSTPAYRRRKPHYEMAGGPTLRWPPRGYRAGQADP